MNLEEFNELKQQHPLTLAYFSTDTCNVCKVLKPQVMEMVERYSPWHFVYINSQQASTVAAQNMVFAVPTIILYAEGKEIKRFSRHFGTQELEALIARYQEMFA